MYRAFSSLLVVVSLMWTSQAAAHVGHVAELAGHGHWIAGAAVIAAAALTAWGVRKPKAEDEAAPEEEQDDDDAPEKETA